MPISGIADSLLKTHARATHLQTVEILVSRKPLKRLETMASTNSRNFGVP